MYKLFITTFLILLISAPVFAADTKGSHHDHRHGVQSGEGFLMPMAPESLKGHTFPKPEPYELKGLYKNVRRLCDEQAKDCYKDALIDVTKKYGARAAIDLYKKLMSEDQDLAAWTHHMAHHIGYFNVITFGALPEILSLCTSDFEYGCIHGFFQGAALSKQLDPASAKQFSDDIAASGTHPDNFVRSIYHGLGHAYMVSVGYDMPAALALCDELEGDLKSECWGGLFMENEDCALMGDWKKCGYSLEDPLAPCSGQSPVYQKTCYFNHTRWLLTLFDGNHTRVLEVCRDIPEGNGEPCLNYLLHTVTEPDWQRNEIEDEYAAYSPDTAIGICSLFPDSMADTCISQTIGKFRHAKKWRRPQVRRFCEHFAQRNHPMCAHATGF